MLLAAHGSFLPAKTGKLIPQDAWVTLKNVPGELEGMAMVDHITPEELDRQIKLAREKGAFEPTAVSASFEPKNGRIVVDLNSGATFMFPVKLAQGLADANNEDLAEVEVIHGRIALYWKKLDVDLSISGLLAGLFGSKAWMSNLYENLRKKGRSRKSPAKAKAARTKGNLGGRPRQKIG